MSILSKLQGKKEPEPEQDEKTVLGLPESSKYIKEAFKQLSKYMKLNNVGVISFTLVNGTVIYSEQQLNIKQDEKKTKQ